MGRFSVKTDKILNENVVLDGAYRFSVITDRIIRIEKSKDGIFEDLPTQVVMYRNTAKPTFKYEIKEDKVLIVTKYTEFIYDKKKDKEYVVVNGEGVDAARNLHNLKGTIRTLDFRLGAVKLGKGIFSKSGVAEIDDSKSYIIDEDGNVKEREHQEKDVYVFNFGQDYFGGIKEFYDLTGYTPLLPKYVLGNWWSRYYAYRQDEYIVLMDKFREKEIPITVATIDMDWHIVKDAPKDQYTKAKGIYSVGWTGYTWNKSLFPDYKQFFKDLKERNLAITLNLHPCDGVRYFEDQYEDMCRACGVDPGTKERVVFNLEDSTFRNAYFDILHHPYEKDGVNFWWIDWQQGKKTKLSNLDPLWLLNHYHTLDIDRDGNKGLILSRYCGPGSHRYPLGFSGDSIVAWSSLKFQPFMTATASNIGYSWWSHDIGGHQFNRGNPDIYVRWVQFGVFSPINRLHSSNTSISKEPWNYPEWAEEIAINYLRLRHKLVPYLYTANVLTAKEGIPLMTPMYWREQSPSAYSAKYQYYFGSEMIVAPVVSKPTGKDKLSPVSFYVPEGNWTDFFTGKKYTNGWYTEFKPMNLLPVLVKEGGIIPMLVEEKKNDLSFEEIEVKIYSGKNEYTMYDEQGSIFFKLDGETLDIVKDEDSITKCIHVTFMDAQNGVVLVNGKEIARGKKVKIRF